MSAEAYQRLRTVIAFRTRVRQYTRLVEDIELTASWEQYPEAVKGFERTQALLPHHFSVEGPEGCAIQRFYVW